MAFDGARALWVGDYVTPRTGQFAGQLGPWAGLVEAVGIEPRSTGMKCVFVAYGLAYVAAAAALVAGVGWARSATGALAVLGLWYLPFGTLANALVLILLYAGRGSRRGADT